VSPEETFAVIKELQRINKQQISNREKVLELSEQLENDIDNDEIRMEIKKLEIENIGLYKRDKQLISKL
jgi:hypothetical protein